MHKVCPMTGPRHKGRIRFEDTAFLCAHFYRRYAHVATDSSTLTLPALSGHLVQNVHSAYYVRPNAAANS